MLKNFKFKFFFSKPNLISNSLLYVGSNITKASNNTLSLDFNNNLDHRKDGKEHVEPFKPFKNKHKRSYEKSCVL
jgi:hypothetical protein